MKKFYNNSRLQGMCWHAGPRVFRLFSGLVASIAVARHLGPEDFGALCFATMVASLLAGLVQLGSLEVVTRTSAVSPEKIGALLRSALMLRLIGAMLGGLLLACMPFWFGHRFVYWILALFPLTLVPDCIEAAFYGRGQFRAMAPLRAASSVFGLVFRLGLVFAEAGITAFAAATILEGLVTGILFLTFRHRLSLPPAASDPLGALFLLRQSLPLVASGMIVAAMLKLDQFLLQTLRPGADVGQYYVVVRLFEMAGVLIPSLVAALLPDLARLRSVSEKDYREKMVRIYRRAYQLGLLAAIIACAVAPWAIPLVFGDQYLGSVPIFMAYSFAFPSFVIGSIRGMEFVVANKNENHLVVALTLFPLQAGLCSLGLIFFGPPGLAGAMAVVAFISTTAFSILLKPLRESGDLQKKAMKGIFR
jgi:O-antigen/teichoic acid export membrane protein